MTKLTQEQRDIYNQVKQEGKFVCSFRDGEKYIEFGPNQTFMFKVDDISYYYYDNEFDVYYL